MASVIWLALSFPTVTVGASSKEIAHVKSVATGGIGSSIAEMKSVHGVARGPGVYCTVKNSCFGTPLMNDETGKTYQFTGILTGDGLILGYDQNFVRGTTAASAIAQILRWLPKDAKVGKLTIDHIGGHCGLLNITSATLSRVLSSPKIGDPTGVVGVDLNYITSNLVIVYNPKNVEFASLDIVPVNPKDSC